MHIRDPIAMILVAVVSFVTASSGAKYIRPDGIVPRDTMRAGNGGATRMQITEVGEVEQQPDQRQSRTTLRSQGLPLRHGSSEANRTETIREEKTLALLLLMLRDGRGAR